MLTKSHQLNPLNILKYLIELDIQSIRVNVLFK